MNKFKITRLHGNHDHYGELNAILAHCTKQYPIKTNPVRRNDKGQVIESNKPSKWMGFEVETELSLQEVGALVPSDRYKIEAC